MKSIWKKALSLILCAAMMIPAGMTAFSAADEKEDPYYKGVFYFRTNLSGFSAADSYDTYTYSDEDFFQSGREYHSSLATTSMAMAVSTASSTRLSSPDDYTLTSRNVTALLEDCGFCDIETNDDYQRKPTEDSVGVVCAHKTVKDGSSACPLLAVFPRSAGYEKEWADNFIIGSSGDAEGFDESADKCLAFLKQYVLKHRITGSVKVWVAGYSRGAAIANLMGKKLIDAPKKYLGSAAELNSDDLFVYTFGTPSAASKENEPKDSKYAGIFNSYSLTELPSSLAPEAMGFERYGTDRIFEDDESDEAMLEYLSLCSPVLYQNYITSSSPKMFHPKKLSIGDSAEIVNDDESYIPNDAAVFLKGLGAYLTFAAGSREMYAEKYEESFSKALGYFLSLSTEQIDAFSSSMLENEDTFYLVAAVYAYFMRSKQSGNVYADTKKAYEVAEELLAVTSRGDMTSSDIGAGDIARVMTRLLFYLTKSPDELRVISAGYLSELLPEAMKRAGATEEEIRYFSGRENMEPLAHMLSFLLFGNIWQSSKVAPFDPDNEQIKNAATLIGNFENCLSDHFNEIIISRLKTQDSRYEPQALTSSQLKGYRRVMIDTDAKISGVIRDSAGNTAGVIRDGELTDTADRWIGFTRCDDGDFFRLPAGESYCLSFSVSDGTPFKVSVKEYDPFEAKAYPVFEEESTAQPSDIITVFLPAVEDEQQFPSKAEYRMDVGAGVILGDADGDGRVTVLDVTVIQKHLASIPVQSFDETAADIDKDGTIIIVDATYIQKFLASMSCPDGIGRPIP